MPRMRTRSARALFYWNYAVIQARLIHRPGKRADRGFRAVTHDRYRIRLGAGS